uniref:Uncharacterized protein n=1 Tax=Vitis vinifera TaxID=29760 RepID=F6H9G1_VITVI
MLKKHKHETLSLHVAGKHLAKGKVLMAKFPFYSINCQQRNLDQRIPVRGNFAEGTW